MPVSQFPGCWHSGQHPKHYASQAWTSHVSVKIIDCQDCQLLAVLQFSIHSVYPKYSVQYLFGSRYNYITQPIQLSPSNWLTSTTPHSHLHFLSYSLPSPTPQSEFLALGRGNAWNPPIVDSGRRADLSHKASFPIENRRFSMPPKKHGVHCSGKQWLCRIRDFRKFRDFVPVPAIAGPQ